MERIGGMRKKREEKGNRKRRNYIQFSNKNGDTVSSDKTIFRVLYFYFVFVFTDDLSEELSGIDLSSNRRMFVVPVSTSSYMHALVVGIEKATSEFLNAPDWTLNINICDAINSRKWHPKDVVKAVKKRLQLKNPNVQLLALTLLETMVKNCGDGLHRQIVERNILKEMTKIVKKKTSFPFKDANVREKVLLLLSSWKDAFGYGGRFPQYYWAYEELRRSGVYFPSSSSEADNTLREDYETKRGQTTDSVTEKLSFSAIDSMRNALGLLTDILKSASQTDAQCVKDEIMVEVVEQCRANQKKLMQLLTTTDDEELVGRGIELNEELQIALKKHDAISNVTKSTTKTQHSPSATVENKQHDVTPSSALVPVTNYLIAEDEEEDDFEHLLTRRSKNTTRSKMHTESTSSRSSESVNSPSDKSSASPMTILVPSPSPSPSPLPLALPSPSPSPSPPSANVGKSSSKNDDMIRDLLSLTLTDSPQMSPNSTNQAPVSYPIDTRDNYVVSWAQTKPEFQKQFPMTTTTTTYNKVSPAISPRNGGATTQVSPSSPNKPYVPPYRLFEDLNVLGTVHGSTLSGMPTQSMVCARK